MKLFLSRLCFTLALAITVGSGAQAQTASSSQSSIAASAGSTTASTENSSANSTESHSSESNLSNTGLARDNALLAAALKALAKEDEIEWIESDQDKIIALYKPSETKVMKGALWILHAPDSPPAWPASLEILRRNLPLFGWASFALPLPPKNITTENSSPTASSASSNTSTAISSSVASASNSSASSQETSSVAASEASANVSSAALTREQIVNQRIDAGFAKLQEKGQLNVVVLIDNSCAALALTNLAGKSAPNSKIKGLAQALVLVNLQTQEPLSKEQLKTIFSNVDLPVMDVFFDPDNAQQAEQRRNHRAEAQRQKLKDYQQVIIPGEDFVNIDNAQSFWLQKVRGFMDKKAESEEAKRVNKK